MRKILPAVLICLICTIAWGSDGREGSFIDRSDEFTEYKISYPEETWIISNELIKRLNLKPHSGGYSLLIEGEDGEVYDWCGVLKAHMDWIEANK